MRKKKLLMAGIAVCAMMVAVCVLLSRKDDGQGKRASVLQSHKPRTPTLSTNGNGSANVAKSVNGNDKFKQRNRTMRFLELATQFLPNESQTALQSVIDEGVDKQPNSFARLGIKYMELFGYLRNSGKLSAYYELLKQAFEQTPTDINLLRTLATVASIPTMNLRAEYETWLAELAKMDSHEDVLFPFAEMLLVKGEAKMAYEQICRTVVDYPSEASEILTNSLRIFTENKATEECDKIVEQLKAIGSLDSFHANSCADILFKDGKLEEAAHFYCKCLTETDSTFIKELSEVKLCTIDVRLNKTTDRTIANLKKLASNSRTPVVRTDARRALISLNIDPPNQPSNSN